MARGIAAAVSIAIIATVVVAWPVISSPQTVIYGHEIAGRHHDAYTVMQQLAGGGTAGIYAQPVTDREGWLFARVLPPVAAYNLLVLLSFPLTAAATYALARYVVQSHAAAVIAALAFTFAPIRLAHAAYHPQVVQTQWLALYLLALFALIDRPGWRRATGVAITFVLLALSNYYGGLIGAVLTPVAIVAYWVARRNTAAGRRSLVVAAGVVGAIAVAGIAVIALRAPVLIAHPELLAFPVADVGRYSARWWAYFTPAVDHPMAGPWAMRIFERAGQLPGLVEQQVFVSYALLCLAGIAVVSAARHWRDRPEWRPLCAVAVVGLFAFFVSLGPPSGSCDRDPWAPACLLYGIAPMFRAYARFAFATHISVALLAGAGAAMLARRSRTGLAVAACLLVAAAIEYSPLPWRAHDVLPTAGHRWLAGRPDAERIFDCVDASEAVTSVPWLMNRPVSFLSPDLPTCADPQIGGRLSRLKYTHVVVRRGAGDSQPPEGLVTLTPVREFPDSRVLAVAPVAAPVTEISAEGFSDWEHEGNDWWRWMTSQGRWTLQSEAAPGERAELWFQLSSGGVPRSVTMTLDGRAAGELQVGTDMQQFVVGPWELDRGTHTLILTAGGPPYRPADDGRSTDARLLTIRIKSEQWVRVHDDRR